MATYRSLFNNSPSVSFVADGETTASDAVEKSCVASRVLPTKVGANESTTLLHNRSSSTQLEWTMDGVVDNFMVRY